MDIADKYRVYCYPIGSTVCTDCTETLHKMQKYPMKRAAADRQMHGLCENVINRFLCHKSLNAKLFSISIHSPKTLETIAEMAASLIQTNRPKG